VVETIIPVRCFSCGKVVGHLWEEYKKRTQAGEDAEKVLNDLGLKRYCCRQLFLGHVDLLKEVAQFQP
jgi:DNA-directed RNA polymerase subunit N